MEIISSIIIVAVIFCLGVIVMKSFSRGKRLTTIPSPVAIINGVFTLILFGGRHGDDLETVAILAPEDNRYAFEPFAPEFRFTVKKGVPAEEAIAAAEMFISRNSAFQQSRISGIIDDRGNVLGYEIRPLYFPIVYGAEDVMEINYSMDANKIIVYVRLNPSVDKMSAS